MSEKNKLKAELILEVAQLQERVKELETADTEQKQALEMLQDSERRFKTIFTDAAIGIDIVDAEGSPILANRALLEMLGYSEDELRSMVFADYTHLDDIEESLQLVQEVREGKRDHFTMEKRYIRKDGTVIWGHTSVSGLRDARGNFQYFIAMVDDITERKQTEEALRESEERYRAVVESSHNGIVIVGDDFKVEYVNDPLSQIFGFSREEIIGQDFRNFLDEELEQLITDRYERHQQGEDVPVRYDFNVRRKDGEQRRVEIRSTIIKEPKGRVRTIVQLMDITERVQAQEAVQIERDNLNNILGAMEDGVYIVNQQYDIQYVNPALENEFGPYKGHKCYAYFHNREDICPWCKNPDVMEGNTVQREWYSSKTGKTYDLIDTPLKNPDGSISKLEISRDITERVQAEESLRRINRALKVISECNQALIHAKEEAELLKNICGIIVNIGEYRLAWIGYAEKDQQKTVRPVAQVGFEEGYLKTVNISWADTERGRGPTGTAIRTGKSSSARNILTDPNFAPWRAEAIKRGYASSLAIPLISGNETFGALNIYAVEPEAFNKEEVTLLRGLAEDLAYGIAALRIRIEYDRSQKALMESEEKFRTLVTNNEEIVYMIAKDGTFLLSEGKGLSKLGLKAGEVVGKSVFELYKDYPDMLDQIRKTFAGEIVITEINVGGIFLRNWYTPYENYEGEIIGLMGLSVNITERVQAEEALKESERKLQRILTTVPLGIGLITDRRLGWSNDRMHEMSGYPLGELLGESATILYENENEYNRAGKIAYEMMNEKGIGEVETQWKRKDNSLFDCLIRIAPLNISNPSEGNIAVISDITERKQAEVELQKYQQQLEVLVEERTTELRNANKELESFSYSVSHDLRAPLRAIDGFTNILLEDYVSKLDDEGKRLGSVIQKNSQKMGQLIDDLLAFSRLGRTSMSFSEIEMKKMANAIYLEETNPKARKRITFKIADLSNVEGDPVMIRQLWTNLVSNALKFSAHVKQAIISVSCQEEEDQLIYCIKDNGAGFNMKYKDKLFNVFQRLHSENEFEGTGVGLALVQQIIHRHGGEVWAEGEVDGGAAFYFSLPSKRRT